MIADFSSKLPFLREDMHPYIEHMIAGFSGMCDHIFTETGAERKTAREVYTYLQAHIIPAQAPEFSSLPDLPTPSVFEVVPTPASIAQKQIGESARAEAAASSSANASLPPVPHAQPPPDGMIPLTPEVLLHSSSPGDNLIPSSISSSLVPDTLSSVQEEDSQFSDVLSTSTLTRHQKRANRKRNSRKQACRMWACTPPGSASVVFAPGSQNGSVRVLPRQEQDVPPSSLDSSTS
jgi:hypothetical protein